MIALLDIDRGRYRECSNGIDPCQYPFGHEVADAADNVLPAAPGRAAAGGGRREPGARTEGARRSRTAPAAQPDPVAAGPGGLRLQPDRAARAQPADRQPPPEGAPRSRAGRARAAGELGLLPRGSGVARRPARTPRLGLSDEPLPQADEVDAGAGQDRRPDRDDVR